MQKIVLTEEQREIVKRVFENRVVLVNAFAGTGKTTTCMATIKEANKRGKKALYLVFNRAMSKSAKEKGNLLGLDKVESMAWERTKGKSQSIWLEESQRVCERKSRKALHKAKNTEKASRI